MIYKKDVTKVMYEEIEESKQMAKMKEKQSRVQGTKNKKKLIRAKKYIKVSKQKAK
jgi:hypothetical protein